MNNLVYGLLDPDTKEIRYIGKSSSGLCRPKVHLRKSSYTKGNSHKNCWIRSLVNKNKVPIIQVLSYHNTQDDAYLAEIEHIAYYRSLGAKLTNYNGGGRTGEGGTPSVDTRRKMSESHKGDRNHFYGKTHTPNTVSKIKAANIGKVQSKETRAKRSKSLSGRTQPKEHVERRALSRSRAITAKHVDTGLVLRYKSAAAAIIDGFVASGISKAIHRRKPYKNFVWDFAKLQ